MSMGDKMIGFLIFFGVMVFVAYIAIKYGIIDEIKGYLGMR